MYGNTSALRSVMHCSQTLPSAETWLRQARSSGTVVGSLEVGHCRSSLRHGKSYSRLLSGKRNEFTNLLRNATGIDQKVLEDKPPSELSVAKGISWASQRTKTRPDDAAYCPFGLFDINIPPLYGEGKEAFRPLQEEIINRADDHSIFA